jgi:tetratricopeptide (TPR) repeat protein
MCSAHQEAQGWLTEALQSAPDAPKELRARSLRWLAPTYFLAGEYESAMKLTEQALELFRELGDMPGIALTLDMLAAPVEILGDHVRARALADESFAIFRQLGDRPGTLYPLSKVAEDEWKHGDRELAVALTEETLELAREVRDDWWLAGRLLALADMSWVLEQIPRAHRLAREALSLAHELGASFHLLYAFGLLSALAAADGDAARAGRLWAAAETIEESGQAVFQPSTRDPYAEAVFALGADLDAGLAEGHAMTLDQAVAYALTE